MGEEHVSSSSFFDLKAEVLKRKKEAEEARKSQLNQPVKRSLTQSSHDLPSVKASRLTRPPQQHKFQVKISPSSDDAEVLAKSRAVLETKSHIYDRLQKDNPTPSTVDEEFYLVDFDRKGWDPIKQEIIEPLIDRLDAVKDPLGFLCHIWSLNSARDLDGRDEEVVEYVDEFGRTRKIKASERAKLDTEKEETIRLLNGLFDEQGLEPKHYDPSWEIRDKGVGFFSFSRDTHDRQRQLRALQDLRQRTLESRARATIAREERRLQSEERRARLRERRAQMSNSGEASSIFASLLSGT